MRIKFNLGDALLVGASVAVILYTGTSLALAWKNNEDIEQLACRVNRMEVILYSGKPQPGCDREEPAK